MHCPYCGTVDTKVVDSRLSEDGAQVRRRRECSMCNERITTFEVAELAFPRVIKRDGERTVFQIEKLRAGMLSALEKRSVKTELVDEAMTRILNKIRASGDREIATKLIGEYVMNELRALDQVAYVRFASVYRSFQDVNEFHEEIQKLKSHGQADGSGRVSDRDK